MYCGEGTHKAAFLRYRHTGRQTDTNRVGKLTLM
jgi:hypothetical protein